jgi:hypothetical protein
MVRWYQESYILYLKSMLQKDGDIDEDVSQN